MIHVQAEIDLDGTSGELCKAEPGGGAIPDVYGELALLALTEVVPAVVEVGE